MTKSGEAAGRSSWLTRLKILGAVALVVGMAVTGLVGSWLVAPAPKIVGEPPADLPAEKVEFDSESGSRIRGWRVPAEEARGVVVLAHGLRASRWDMVDRARFLHRAGYAVLLYDAQAHGESPGEQLTLGVLESHDARAAVEFARGWMPEAPIVFLGCSMGGASALLGAEPLAVDALVLEAVYPTLREAVESRIALFVGPLDRWLAPLLLIQVEPRIGVKPEAVAPIEGIGRVGAPVLIVAGELDDRTTHEQSRRIFERASEPKEMWVVEGAGHVDFHRAAPAEYEQRVLGFLERAGL